MATLDARVVEGLGSPLARRVEVHETLASTQERARELALEDRAPHGTLVVARVQTGGRGRLGRRWGSPPGGLWMSLILRLDLAPHLAPRITPAAAVAVAKVLRGMGVNARIKWPNDLLVGGAAAGARRKVCGILAEAAGHAPDNFVVLGIGVNANVDPWDLEATPGVVASLRSELGRHVDLLALLEAVLAGLDFELGRIHDFEVVLEDWRTLDCILGERVRVRRLGEVVEGRALDLGPEGSLLLETNGGMLDLFEGEVEQLRKDDEPVG